MKKSFWKVLSFICVFVFTFSFFSCVESGTTYTASDWEGVWKIDEEIVFPKSTKASYKGSIKAVDDYNIIISGELFGLNSSCEVAAIVSSKTAKFDQMVSGNYQLVGSATLANDTITFKFDIKLDDKTKGYTRKAIKL